NIALSGTVDGVDISTDVVANTAKVTNATHTGEITGDVALTADPSIIGNRVEVTAATGDMILITDASDSNLLKKVDAVDFIGISGDVDGPASATDNAIARFDLTTGKIIQGSGVVIDDAASISGAVNIALTGNITLTAGTVDGIDISTDVPLNTAKVTNATHTDEMTGSVALTAQPAIISNRSTVSAAAGDLILIQDASDGTLQNVDASDLLLQSDSSQTDVDTSMTGGGSNSYQPLDSMTVTPGAGDYLVYFSAYMEINAGNKNANFCIFVGGIQVSGGERIQRVRDGNRDYMITIIHKVSGVVAAEAIEIHYHQSNTGNTITVHDRSLNVIRMP
ncbi:MAG: hypothetical protein HRU15_12580, partial [Planctomycetes bacterium]|nr:hypothetical protein [Planctomycetota bacterium]